MGISLRHPASTRHFRDRTAWVTSSRACVVTSTGVTITVEDHLLEWFEQRAAVEGAKLSPTIVKVARNWLLREDATRVAEADLGRGVCAPPRNPKLSWPAIVRLKTRNPVRTTSRGTRPVLAIRA
jgi:hypothetical protein